MKSIALGVPFFLLLLFFVPGIAAGQQAPAITISQSNAKLVIVTFSPRELQQVETNPNFILSKLGPATARDCAYPRRISSCIWACPSGRKIRTCDAPLVRALERIWPK